MSGIFMHDFHVSVSQIEFDQKNQAIEISQRIFADDFEKILNLEEDDATIDILIEFNNKDVLAKIKAYVLENFKVSINGKRTELNYLGAKLEGDAVVCFIEISKIKKLKSIMVESTILTAMFADQVNLVHVKVNGKNKSMKLDLRQPSQLFEY